jgi:hypothetical protein
MIENQRTQMLLDPVLIQWLVFLALVWLIILSFLLVQSLVHYRRLTKNITKKDLKTVLSEVLNKLNLNEKQLKDLDLAMQQARQKMRSHIQKIGFVRFNPFPQTGGDQSFCLVLLDEKDSGFVLSSLHSRDATRFYAKTIKNGKGDGYELSKEEKQAVARAK